MFDTKITENCCNCVSIVLYSSNSLKLSNYLPNILVSLNNMEKYLPNWIMRLYLDKTVFENIYLLQNTSVDTQSYAELRHAGNILAEILKKITEHPICELYVTVCEKFFDPDFNMSSMRRMRFNGLYDKTVNINACRDADGILMAYDCHNLKVLEKRNIILYAYPYSQPIHIEDNDLSKPTHYVVNFDNHSGVSHYPASTYGKWHDMFKEECIHLDKNIGITDSYYLKKYELFRLLAGLFSSKCRFKKAYYDMVVANINEKYRKINEKLNEELSIFNLEKKVN